MKCPKCGSNTGTVHVCDNCGDTRCNSTGAGGKGCAGSKSPFGNPQPGYKGKSCYVCKKGKYK